MADPAKALHYDRLLPSVRADWDTHDGSCASLRWFWFGHTGGVTALSDVQCCMGCETYFWLEGVAWVNWADDDADELFLCACCAPAYGYEVRVDDTGVRPVDG